jgi:hypothetical protein
VEVKVMGIAVLGEGHIRDMVLKKTLKEYYQWMDELAEEMGFPIKRPKLKAITLPYLKEYELS